MFTIESLKKTTFNVYGCLFSKIKKVTKEHVIIEAVDPRTNRNRVIKVHLHSVR